MKMPRKTSILKLQSVKFEEISQDMLVLMLQHVSSRVAGFFGASQCLWGKLQNISSSHVAGVELCDIFQRVYSVSNVVLRGSRNTFAPLSEDDL